MKKFLIIVSLFYLCGVGTYAQTSPNNKKEIRKIERLARRAKRQEKKLKNKIETIAKDSITQVEQEESISTADRIINEDFSDNTAVKKQNNVHNSDTQKVKAITPKVESNTKVTEVAQPSKKQDYVHNSTTQKVEAITPKTESNTKITDVSVVNKTEPIKDSPTNSDDNGFTILIIIVVIIMILKWIFSGRCKKCGKLWAMRTIDEQYLGRSKTKMEKDNQGNHYQVHYNNIRVVQRCQHCGYTTTHVEERKG